MMKRRQHCTMSLCASSGHQGASRVAGAGACHHYDHYTGEATSTTGRHPPAADKHWTHKVLHRSRCLVVLCATSSSNTAIPHNSSISSLSKYHSHHHIDNSLYPSIQKLRNNGDSKQPGPHRPLLSLY